MSSIKYTFWNFSYRTARECLLIRKLQKPILCTHDMLSSAPSKYIMSSYTVLPFIKGVAWVAKMFTRSKNNFDLKKEPFGMKHREDSTVESLWLTARFPPETFQVSHIFIAHVALRLEVIEHVRHGFEVVQNTRLRCLNVSLHYMYRNYVFNISQWFSKQRCQASFRSYLSLV